MFNMETSNDFLGMLPVLLLVVIFGFLAYWYFLQNYGAKATKKTETGKEKNKAAYERLIILVERSKLQNLVNRVPASGQPLLSYQRQLTAEVHNEYQHNLAQQLYVGDSAWQHLSHFIEYTVAAIHSAATEIEAGSSDFVLAQKLIVDKLPQQNTYADNTLRALKQDFAS